MIEKGQKIAIIGSGISGLGAAYLLNQSHDVTVFEKNDYIGGHSRTIDVMIANKRVPVDTGFIVFNDWNYPHLTGLFDTLGVPYEKSNMSFGVSIHNGWLEYSSNSLFAGGKNLLRPKFWRMLYDILRFNKKAQRFIDQDPDITLGDCLSQLKMGSWFTHYYILAMGAAIWSCSVETMMKFPVRSFVRFFKNHGLLNIINRPQWYTVTGGSREYIKILTKGFAHNIHLSCAITHVKASNNSYELTDMNGYTHIFDHVVFACHADEALAMIETPPDPIKNTLKNFTYQNNKVVVHTDESFMPQIKACWASWVYLSESRDDQNDSVSLSYWMNNLQNMVTDKPLIITLNPGREPDKSAILDIHHFSHPIFDSAAIKAQGAMNDIQGKQNLWFCGAYQRYGFHEDGLLSAVNVAKSIGVSIPWEK